MKRCQAFLMPARQHYLSILSIIVFLLTSVMVRDLYAQGNTPASLHAVAMPPVPGLVDGDNPIVVNKTAAIQLGKALFWDVAVGSDGMACASCHFHAGADRRRTNQLATGTFHHTASGQKFQATAAGQGGPNYTLKRSDFPFYQLVDPLDKNSTMLFNSDDIVSSAGVFARVFSKLNAPNNPLDECTLAKDKVFHVNGNNVRQVQQRNVPSVINAGFNFRNFWDGRANNIFNGVTAYGDRDTDAGIWELSDEGLLTKHALHLENSSLASQAVAPPLNSSEMSCQHRTFLALAAKLLPRAPLAGQAIHPTDSVLAALRHASGKGLDTTYKNLITTAFAPRYWAAKEGVDRLQTGQLEANFAMFFGLALQLYQQTLVSDQTPFDTPRRTHVYPHEPEGLNDSQLRGLKKFLAAGCDVCHKGPSFSAAAHPAVYRTSNGFSTLRLVNRDLLNGAFSGGFYRGTLKPLMDEGYFNTSVTPTSYDPGVGGVDPYGNPLSFSEQYAKQLIDGTPLVDPIAINACDFNKNFTDDYQANELMDDRYQTGDCGLSSRNAKIPKLDIWQAEVNKAQFGRAYVATQGAFKVPSLRNIELTGPYMHNGSMLTLEQVVDFYFRGGNFTNTAHFAALVLQQPITPKEKKDLVAFLKSLTDERVRWEQAPFDHPQLTIPHGHADSLTVTTPGQAMDNSLSIPAVGKAGRSVAMGPLKPFQAYLAP